jgi:predicted transcriptional regulator
MATSQTAGLKLEPDMEDRLHRLAAARQSSAEGLLREAIEQYVDREEKRAQLNKDMVASWEDYQATGLHVTGEEVDAWLAKLEAGEDAEPPVPHK